MDKDFTLLIQGPLNEESLKFYIYNYSNLNVVCSTWNDDIEKYNKLKLFYSKLSDKYSKLFEKVIFIFNEPPKCAGSGNFNFQAISTINGLKQVQTDFVVKLRSDEYYSNLDYIFGEVKNESDKWFCSSTFFRPFLAHIYHSSDHIIIAKRRLMLDIFEKTFEKSKIDPNMACELGLTLTLLEYNGFNNFEDLEEGKNKMKENFRLIDFNRLKPYKMISNQIKKAWYNDFTPWYYWSIRNFDDL